MSFRPPKAQALSIRGPAGALESLLEDPQAPVAAGFAVICHPHPLFGGTMQNKVVHTLGRACQEFGLATLRFNFRGVGASDGSHDEGRAEIEDAMAVIAWGRQRWPDGPLTLAGFSFGAMVALAAAVRSAPSKLITVAPAVGRPEFSSAAKPNCPWLIVQGDADELVDIRDVRAFAARFEPAPKLVVMSGVEHFFHGRLTQLRDEVLAFLKNEEAR
ncbi:MAG TPA: alpha/beta fold hydrolase [Steroidobacteraceae bacterium]|nr:alpha/beta fold hydrolase [Steroidobacteraceae bacterium]